MNKRAALIATMVLAAVAALMVGWWFLLDLLQALFGFWGSATLLLLSLAVYIWSFVYWRVKDGVGDN